MAYGPAPARLKAAAELLRTKVLAMVTAGFERAALRDLYATRIGGYDAVSMHLEMTKGESGAVYLVKAAAILHPGRANGVFAFLMANNRLSAIRTTDDLRSKGVGLQIIHSLLFIEGAAPR